MTAFSSANKSKAPLKFAATPLPPAEKVTSKNLTKREIESGVAIILALPARARLLTNPILFRLPTLRVLRNRRYQHITLSHLPHLPTQNLATTSQSTVFT